jgi:hypothetical protein
MANRRKLVIDASVLEGIGNSGAAVDNAGVTPAEPCPKRKKDSKVDAARVAALEKSINALKAKLDMFIAAESAPLESAEKLESLSDKLEEYVRNSKIACQSHAWLCQNQIASRLVQMEAETSKFHAPKDTSVYVLAELQSAFLEAVYNNLGTDAVLLHKICRFSLSEYEHLSLLEQSTKVVPATSGIFIEFRELS